MTRLLYGLMLATVAGVLVGCSVAMAQGVAPATASVDPVATLVGAGGLGTAGIAAISAYIGRMFERFMNSFDKAIEVMEEVRDALQSLDVDVAERTKRRRAKAPA